MRRAIFWAIMGSPPGNTLGGPKVRVFTCLGRPWGPKGHVFTYLGCPGGQMYVFLRVWGTDLPPGSWGRFCRGAALGAPLAVFRRCFTCLGHPGGHEIFYFITFWRGRGRSPRILRVAVAPIWPVLPPGAPGTRKYVGFAPPGVPDTVKYKGFAPPGRPGHREIRGFSAPGRPGHRKI